MNIQGEWQALKCSLVGVESARSDKMLDLTNNIVSFVAKGASVYFLWQFSATTEKNKSQKRKKKKKKKNKKRKIFILTIWKMWKLRKIK